MFESLPSDERGDGPPLDIESIRGWVYAHKRLVALLSLTAALLLVVAAATLRPASARTPVELSLPRATAQPVTVAVQVVVVHVSGAVSNPGVFTAEPGSRVADLVEAAGGLRPDAAPDRVNLAAVVRDGDQIHIPVVGEQPTRPDGAVGTTRVDLNRATAAEFQVLPGIGPALGQAIVDHRDRFGNFKTIESLEEVSGIGPSKIERIRDLVAV